MHVGVCIPVHWPLDGAGNDLLLPVKLCSIVQNAINDERPVLHKALHSDMRPVPELSEMYIKTRIQHGDCKGPTRPGSTS